MAKSDSKEKTLPHKKLKLVIRLLESPDLETAAAACGISMRTAYRWWDDPAFQVVYQRAVSALIERVSARLAYGSQLAVDKLIECLEAPDKVDRKQLSAADKILKYSIPLRDAAVLEQKLEEILHALEAQTSDRTYRSTNGRSERQATTYGF